MTPWHTLPREAVDAPSLESLNAKLDGSLIWWGGTQPMAGVQTLDGL